MGDQASSTVTDLRHVMMRCALENLNPDQPAQNDDFNFEMRRHQKGRLSGAQSSNGLPNRKKFNMNNTISVMSRSKDMNGNLRNHIW